MVLSESSVKYPFKVWGSADHFPDFHKKDSPSQSHQIKQRATPHILKQKLNLSFEILKSHILHQTMYSWFNQAHRRASKYVC